MDIGKLAAVTALDVYVVVALALLATGMWVGRRFVGVLLKFVPAFLALGAAVIIAISGWIAVALQIRRIRRPRPARSPARTATFNNIRVTMSLRSPIGAKSMCAPTRKVMRLPSSGSTAE